MEKIIILNNKMNLEYDEVHNYINKLNNIETNNSIIICPSSIYLESFINNSSWGIGSQDVYYRTNGDFTGEISTTQLKSLGIEYSLIGHYERKKYFKESNKMINKKLNACIDSNICPILCFGETGNIEDIKSSLDVLLNGIDNINFIIFAYEPLMLENIPTPEQISEYIDSIYDYLYNKYKTKPNIVYGGGVSDNNIKDILKIEKLNGVLIGSISTNIDKIEKIIKESNN